jgi:Nitrile hydratase beta subunit
VEYGVLTTDDLARARVSIEDGIEPPRVEDAERVAAVERLIVAATPMAPATGARFAVGDAVVPRRMYEPDVHHRCPRYVRGVPGVVETVCGIERLAGYRQHTTIEPVYTVRFESIDVWGPRHSEPPYALHVDLWESYLEAR